MLQPANDIDLDSKGANGVAAAIQAEQAQQFCLAKKPAIIKQ